MMIKINQIKDSKLLWYTISSVILGALIIFADVSQFLSAIRNVDPLLMGASFVTGLSVFLVWGYIWHSLFQELEFEINMMKSYKIVMAGNFMNSVTPFGQLGGEPFMAYIVSENTDESYEKSLSAVVSADLVNAIPFLTYAMLGIMYMLLFSTITESIRNSIYIFVFFNILLISVAYLAWFKTDKLESKIQKILDNIESRIEHKGKIIESLRERIEETKDSFKQAGKDKRHLIKIISITHLAPATQLISLYLILLGLNVEPTFIGVYLHVMLSGLAMFSPTPGGTGTFEAAFTGLLLFSYPNMGIDTAVASSVLFRLTTYWPGLIIGYFSLLSLKHQD